jgi:hypothetical protein
VAAFPASDETRRIYDIAFFGEGIAARQTT